MQKSIYIDNFGIIISHSNNKLLEGVKNFVGGTTFVQWR